MTNGHGRLVRRLGSAAVLVAAGIAALVTALQLPGALGTVLSVLTAVLGVSVTLAVEGPWKRAQARHEVIRSIIRQVPGGGSGRLSTVSSMIDLMAMAVHPAVPLRAAGKNDSLEDWPAYIERDVDVRLGGALTSGHSAFIVLVGPPSSGKTRTVIHNLLRHVGNWRLFWPASAQQLNDYVEASGDLRRTVVWLDNIAELLISTPAVSLASIAHILRTGGPTVVVGTITTTLYDEVSTSAANTPYEVSSAAKHILRAARIIYVDIEFSPAELERAEQLASDPVISEALLHGESRLTEFLAAVPDLRTRWRAGTETRRGEASLGACVVTAAALCRNAGHPNPIPKQMLQAAAFSLLTDRLKATLSTNWFDVAVAWASEPVRGDVSMLTPRASAPGYVDTFDVHEAIAQATATAGSGHTRKVTPEIWEIVTERCAIEVANRIGYAAIMTDQLEAARKAWLKAAEGGDLDAMYNIGLLLRDGGDTAAAEAWLAKGAEAGGIQAMYGLGILLADSGRTTEAEAWLAKGATGGDPIAMYNFAKLLHDQGQNKRAQRWYEKAANYGLMEAIRSLGSILAESNNESDIEQATLWLSRGARLGDAYCAFQLGSLFFQAKEIMRAETYLRQAAEDGLPVAMGLLGIVLVQLKRLEEAERRLRRAVEGGHIPSMINLSNVLKLSGRLAESAHWSDRWYAAASEQEIDAGMRFSIGALPRNSNKPRKSRKSTPKRGRR